MTDGQAAHHVRSAADEAQGRNRAAAAGSGGGLPARGLAAACLAAALGLGWAASAAAADPCSDLVKLRIPARAIALPTRGATIDKAAVFAAEGDLPETCRVNGEIRGSTSGAPPIRFQVNLPTRWNGKAVQFGGAGFNGLLVDGLGAVPGSAPGGNAGPHPLARGYATFGSDGGHQASDPFDSSFARQREARANYTGAAVKRLRDVAVAVILARYGSPPKRLYYAGGSKGGHEALVAAQRHGADYDGVLAFYPAKDSVGLILAWGALTEAAYGPGGTPLSAQKQALVQRAVLTACDALDGLADGVVANTAACAATISPASLTCAVGQPADTCLSTAEAATLAAGLRRTQYPYPLAHDVSALGPFPVLSGATLVPFWFSPAGRAGTMYEKFVLGIARDFWTLDPGARFATLDLARLRPVIVAHAQQSEANATDLDDFAGHGGKLILVQGTLDMLTPPSATTDYFLRVAARYGTRTSDFVRYFIQPGYGHGVGPFTLSWDSLAALDNWVETGTFPPYAVATDASAATVGRQMPLCDYPLFPRYVAGDPRQASSFRCSGH